jgi:serine/threonine-protein kinase
MASTVTVQRPSFVLSRRYDCLGEIGHGHLSVVLRAFNVEALGQVTVKVLRPELEGDAELRAALLRQGTELARVRSANVVQVLEVVAEPSPFYVMPPHEGARPLSALRARGPAPTGAIAAIGIGLASGLAALHAAGLVHADLRPETVLVQRGRPILFDLGLARDLNELSLKAGSHAGNDYAAPEVISGAAMTERSDLYALGVILHEIAAGRCFFRGSDPIETTRRHLMERAPSLRGARPELPPAFDALLRALLAKEPGERPASAALVASRIEEALGGLQ